MRALTALVRGSYPPPSPVPCRCTSELTFRAGCLGEEGIPGKGSREGRELARHSATSPGVAGG